MYFQVRFGYRVIIYDCRALIRLTVLCYFLYNECKLVQDLVYHNINVVKLQLTFDKWFEILSEFVTGHICTNFIGPDRLDGANLP